MRFQIESNALYGHRLRVFSPNKKYVLSQLTLPPPQSTNPTVSVVQHPCPALPPTLSLHNATLIILPGPYNYIASGEWWVNFADADLFGFYGTNLFAQDELQCLEIPHLMHLREYMLHNNISPRTRDSTGRPTPVLVMHAERLLAFDTTKRTKEAPRGIYGNQFSAVKAKVIQEQFCTVLEPQLVHIVAMEAPKHGFGEYTFGQVMDVLVTACGAFGAVRKEGARMVHSGNWGCGAFGGNVVLMALLQMVAARAAGVNLTCHVMQNENEWRQAQQLMEQWVGETLNVHAFVQKILEHRFKWNYGNGT